MRFHLALALAALVLAGCLSPEAPTTIDQQSLPSPAIETAASATLAVTPSPGLGEVPVWNVGDAWAVTAVGPDAAEEGILAVVAVGSDSYTLATTSGQLAGYDAMFDISYVGPIRARDLAGAQQGTPVQFFDFPLADQKTWTTTWDGREVKLVATANPAIPTPLGPQPGFAIVGTVADASYVTYDYVPALRWWSHLEFAEGYGFKVTRAMTEWKGAYSVAVAELLFEGGSAAPLGGPGAGSFTVTEGQTSVVLMIQAATPAGARALAITDPSGAPYMTSTPNAEAWPSATRMWEAEELPPTPGTWHIAAPVVHHPEGGFSVRVHQVAVEEKLLA